MDSSRPSDRRRSLSGGPLDAHWTRPTPDFGQAGRISDNGCRCNWLLGGSDIIMGPCWSAEGPAAHESGGRLPLKIPTADDGRRRSSDWGGCRRWIITAAPPLRPPTRVQGSEPRAWTCRRDCLSISVGGVCTVQRSVSKSYLLLQPHHGHTLHTMGSAGNSHSLKISTESLGSLLHDSCQFGAAHRWGK
jgi:hypothetical protein